VTLWLGITIFSKGNSTSNLKSLANTTFHYCLVLQTNLQFLKAKCLIVMGLNNVMRQFFSTSPKNETLIQNGLISLMSHE
jgi:hypothetical protein